MMRTRIRASCLIGSLLVTGCGSDGDPPASPPPQAAPQPTGGRAPPTTPPPAVDHGAVSTNYPAFPPDVAQLQNKGGKVLTKPVVVTVNWDDNPNAAMYEALADTIGATAYWKTIVGEYGVGALTSGPASHVRAAATPIALPEDPNDAVQTLAALVTDALEDRATSGWPAPTDQTIYALFLTGRPAETLCESGVGGFHDSVTVGGADIAYAVVNECDSGLKLTKEQAATIAASHEFAEASVDPIPETNPGWQGLDAKHLAWKLMQMGQDENADLCEFYEDAYGPVAAPEIPFFVQRQWSNAQALAGHAPCVPAPAEPYFNVTPVLPINVLVDFSPDPKIGKLPPRPYVKLGLGDTAHIPIGFYSDGPTEPFEVRAYEGEILVRTGAPFQPASTRTLDIELDKTTGQNGEKAMLTVTMNKVSPVHVQLVLLETTLGSSPPHYMPLLVGNVETAPPRGPSVGGGDPDPIALRTFRAFGHR